MILRTLTAVLSLAIAQPAVALSCMRPEVALSFLRADSAPEPFVMALGQLTAVPGQSLPPEPENPNERAGYTLRTTFDGHFATRSGFDQPAQMEVTLQVRCFGPWCGGLPVGEHILFLQRTEDSYLLDAGPCAMFALGATPAARAEALSCLNDGPCG